MPRKQKREEELVSVPKAEYERLVTNYNGLVKSFKKMGEILDRADQQKTRVRARTTIIEKDFNGEKEFIHARPGDEGEIIHTNKDGYPTVMFGRSSTIVNWSEIALV